MKQFIGPALCVLMVVWAFVANFGGIGWLLNLFRGLTVLNACFVAGAIWGHVEDDVTVRTMLVAMQSKGKTLEQLKWVYYCFGVTFLTCGVICLAGGKWFIMFIWLACAVAWAGYTMDVFNKLYRRLGLAQ